MQLNTRIKQKSVTWNDKLKPRVGDVVLQDGVCYFNTSGINSAVTNTSNWFPIKGSNTIVIDKVAADILGSDDTFTLSLASDGVPPYPSSVSVYLDVNGNGVDVEFVQPVLYNPTTRILRGMINPEDYPNQKVKILMT